MNVFVARLAESDTVGNIVSQFVMMLPRLYVVRLYAINYSALLAGVAISGVHGFAPLPIFVGVALFVGVWFALGGVAAFLAAIFGTEASASPIERCSTPLTGKRGSLSALARQFAPAPARASCDRLGAAKSPLEWFTADDTVGFMTGIAHALTWIRRLEYLPAYSAGNGSDGYGRRMSTHTHIIARDVQFRNMERWSTATGKTPVLIQ